MRSTESTGRPTASLSARSLRSRWNRAFAVLFAVVVLGGMATFTGTRLLIDSYRTTAERVEEEATVLADLRGEILPHAVLLSGMEDLDRIPAFETSIRGAFAAGIADSDDADEREPLQQASDRWEAMVAAAGPLDRLAPVAQRGGAIAAGVPAVLTLLDQAGSAGRARARVDLARAGSIEKAATASRAVFVLLVSALMLRFARRLSAEVLRPVGLLRDSANQLAVGELDHRVENNRSDELGDLAASFNAMADVIAGSQRSLIQQANHDSLTGLANRAAFHARLEAALARPDRRADILGVLFVDLDDFKDVNDTLGHGAGDELLRVVATRLQAAVRPGDLVARLGGDEFALLLDGVPDPAVALGVAERAVAALALPVEITGTWVHLGASAGLAMRHEGSDPESLMREADVAMYSAKGQGKNRVERYDATLIDAVADRHAREVSRLTSGRTRSS